MMLSRWVGTLDDPLEKLKLDLRLNNNSIDVAIKKPKKQNLKAANSPNNELKMKEIQLQDVEI